MGLSGSTLGIDSVLEVLPSRGDCGPALVCGLLLGSAGCPVRVLTLGAMTCTDLVPVNPGLAGFVPTAAARQRRALRLAGSQGALHLCKASYCCQLLTFTLVKLRGFYTKPPTFSSY